MDLLWRDRKVNLFIYCSELSGFINWLFLLDLMLKGDQWELGAFDTLQDSSYNKYVQGVEGGLATNYPNSFSHDSSYTLDIFFKYAVFLFRGSSHCHQPILAFLPLVLWCW